MTLEEKVEQLGLKELSNNEGAMQQAIEMNPNHNWKYFRGTKSNDFAMFSVKYLEETSIEELLACADAY